MALSLPGAFADAKRLVDGGQFHVRLLAAVTEEVHPADHSQDRRRPRLPACPWSAATAALRASTPASFRQKASGTRE